MRVGVLGAALAASAIAAPPAGAAVYYETADPALTTAVLTPGYPIQYDMLDVRFTIPEPVTLQDGDGLEIYVPFAAPIIQDLPYLLPILLYQSIDSGLGSLTTTDYPNQTLAGVTGIWAAYWGKPYIIPKSQPRSLSAAMSTRSSPAHPSRPAGRCCCWASAVWAPSCAGGSAARTANDAHASRARGGRDRKRAVSGTGLPKARLSSRSMSE